MSETAVRDAPAPGQAESGVDSAALLKVKLFLLRSRRWRYLRYVHFRNYLRTVANSIETVCVCGAGGGFAEIAAAIEFPHIRFTLTDIIANGYPSYHRAMEFAWKVGIDNVSYSVWNVLGPTKRRFDLVASTEMLEHIEDDVTAAANMRGAARKYIYCLVPFAEDGRNEDPAARKRAWEQCEHYVCGYDADRLRALFGPPAAIAGTYWAHRGAVLRGALETMSLEDIDAQAPALFDQAALDDTGALPSTVREAAGIKILASV